MMKKKRLTHLEVKRECLKDPETLVAYNDLEEEYQLINAMLNARKRAGCTQETLAKKMKTTKSTVSRLESLQAKGNHSPSFKTLKRYARALGCVLKIQLVPIA